MSQFVLKAKLAAETFAATDIRFIKFYLMNAVLCRAQQAEQARAKSPKSASGRVQDFDWRHRSEEELALHVGSPERPATR
jgi:hypothetical protein